MPQRILVTAGAAGIGRAIAGAFHALGAQVFICDIDEPALHAAAAALPGLGIARCDIAHRDDVAAMVDRAAAALGGIDVLVNNAGITGPTAPVAAMDPDGWERVLQVNLTGTFNVTRLVIPHLIAAGGGAIINMSSVAGRVGYPNRSAYATTKWGLIGFTKTLSMELGRHQIRVNAILPGAVQGDRLEAVFARRAAAGGQTIEDVKDAEFRKQSLRRFVPAEEVAALAVYLASDAAKSISGQALPIDGDQQSNAS